MSSVLSLPSRSIYRVNRSVINTTAAAAAAAALQPGRFIMSKTGPGSDFEPRQTTSDVKPDPSKSLPLTPARQALLDDILGLYSCHPTRARIERYTPDCVYDDLFGYADNRYKVAGQWFALPKLFSASESAGYQVTRSDDEVLQFKNEQKWTFRLIPKTVSLPGLITLTLDPETVHSEFIRVKYHKDQASGSDYSHEGVGFTLKKWQADHVADWMGDEDVKYFAKDNVSQKK